MAVSEFHRQLPRVQENQTNLIWGLFSGLLSDGVAVPPDDLLLAEDGVIAGDLKIRSANLSIIHF